MRRINRFIACGVSLLLLGYGLFYLGQQYADSREQRQKRIAFEKRQAEWITLDKKLAERIRQFQGEAGIVIKDLATKQEINFNKNKFFPSASIVKIPIMLACLSAIEAGKLKLTNKVKIKNSHKAGGSGTLKYKPAGTFVTLEELLQSMIIESDNTAANRIIDLLGFNYLNNFFKSFGLKNTNLSRKMMEFAKRVKGVENYTTAEDMAYVLENLYQPKGVSPWAAEYSLKLLKVQRYNDRIPAKLPYYVTVAHKTGLERKVCHDVGIVFAPEGAFLICVLTAGVGNSAVAKEFISDVAAQAYVYFSARPYVSNRTLPLRLRPSLSASLKKRR